MKQAHETLFASVVLILLMALAVGGCNLFGDDEKEDELGWKKVSMPSDLKGVWYKNGVEYINVGSKKVIVDNREWLLMSVYKKDDETRLECESGIQHRAFYFRNIHEESVEVSYGYIAYSSYDAKTAPRGEWVELSKLK